MSLLLEALAPLLKKRDTYYVALILVLLAIVLTFKQRIKVDELALAARPKVEIHTETQIKTVRVAGPVRVETKTVYVPGTTQIQYIDRVVDSAPVTTTTQKESEADKKISPACPASAPAPWRYVGLMADPSTEAKIVGVRGGVTLFRRLDLGVGARFEPRREYELEAAIRF